MASLKKLVPHSVLIMTIITMTLWIVLDWECRPLPQQRIQTQKIALPRANPNTIKLSYLPSPLLQVFFTDKIMFDLKTNATASLANEKVVIQKAVVEDITPTEQQVVEESLSQLTLNDFVKVPNNEIEVATQDLLCMLGLSNTTSRSTSPSVVCAETEMTDVAPKQPEINSEVNVTDVVEPSVDRKTLISYHESDDEDGDDNEETSSEETEAEEIDDEEILSGEDVELFYADSDDYDDVLLKEDMEIMNDFMEHIALDEGEDLNDLLAWSAMQDGNLALMSSGEEEIYDYAALDKESAEKTLSDFEEETAAILRETNKVEQGGRKKYSHKTRVDDTIVDPEIFGQTLKAALADVPPGLRPGVRRWYEKQQRKEERQKKKDEAKAHKRENKKNGKGKAKEENDEDFTNQMARIDE